MTKFFLITYQFFQPKKSAFFLLLLLGILATSIALSFQLNLEEDITKVMPVEDDFTEYSDLFSNSDFADRIIIQLTTIDSLGSEKTAEELTIFSDSLIGLIKARTDSTLLKGITHQIDESQFLDLYEVILDNLPVFLQELDYQGIERKLEVSEIRQRIKSSYKALISPAGFAMKKPILKDPLGLAQNALRHLQGFQIDDNFELQKGYILTKDQRHQILFLGTANSSKETFKNARLISILEEVISTVETKFQGRVTANYFGAPAVAVGNANRIKTDVAMTVGIALLVLFCLIAFFFRRKRAFFLVLLPTVFGGLTAVAALVLIKGTVSLIALGIGSVLLGITIDYSLHIFTHYRSTGKVDQVIKDVAHPILLSSLTTAGAFLCLLLVRSEALHDLGLFAAISVFGSAVYALLILPHLLPFTIKIENGIKTKTTFLDRFGGFELERVKWMFPAILLISGMFYFMGSKAHFEMDLNALNYQSANLKVAEQNLASITAASMRGMYLLSKGQTLETVLEQSENSLPLLDSLKNEGLIRAYTPVANALMSNSLQQKRIAQWKAFWTAERKELVQKEITETANKLKFKPTAFQGFFDLLNKNPKPVEIGVFEPFKQLFLKEYFSEKPNEIRLLTLLRVDLENKSAVHQRFKNHPELRVLDKELLATQFVEVLKEDFDRFVLISLIFVFLVLHIAYGRLELAVITFLPIVVSWLWTLALMDLLDIKFNIVNIIIATFIFGLGIDFSIFMMRGLLQEWKYGERNLHSYKISILLSVMTTLTGIGVMIFAVHPALKSIAALSIIGVSSVLLIALVVEPVLFRWLVYKPLPSNPNQGQNREEAKKKRVPREYPITFLVIFQTLANYIQLAIGCLLLTIFSLTLLLLFFIPLNQRKRWVNYGIWLLSKGYIRLNFLFNETYLNPHQEDFSKGAIAIANHQSLMDTPILFRVSPKQVILTKDWVRKFPLFRLVTWMADFYSVSEGPEKLLPKLEQKLTDGYTIAVFPEGQRSPTDRPKRFKKGSFYVAEKLGADIVPVYIHGTGRFLRKGSLWGKWNPLTVKIGERISSDDPRFVGDYSAKTKFVSRFFKQNLELLRDESETVHYWREKLLENYLYKGPVLEWYMKVKTRLENNYELFDQLIPKRGIITNLGCGYGFLDYMLSFRSNQRDLLGVDYDEEKIKTAQNCACKTPQINFEISDICEMELRKSDVFILADVLHYLPKEKQYQTLEKCAKQLHKGGFLLIRDGDADLKQRHEGTRWTEIFSTQILHFNKIQNPLSFLSGTELRQWAVEQKFQIEVIDDAKLTSNVVFILRKN